MRLTLLIAVLTCTLTFAEDDLKAEATSFIEQHESKEDAAKWGRWWNEYAEQAQRDHNLANEEQAADRYLTAWFRSRQDRFDKDKTKRKDLTVAEKTIICHFYLKYKEKGWLIPERIAEHITRKTYEELFAEKKQ